MTGTTFIVFKNSVPWYAIENSPNNFLEKHLFMSCCIQLLKRNALSLHFYSKNNFSKNIHYVMHLIFKNGINNIFPSQTSSLLLSSNIRQHFFAVGLFSKFKGLSMCPYFWGNIHSLIEKWCSFLNQNRLAASTNFSLSTCFL